VQWWLARLRHSWFLRDMALSAAQRSVFSLPSQIFIKLILCGGLLDMGSGRGPRGVRLIGG
jgi:hypothetical protein